MRYAIRVLLKNPGFSLVAILSLALGIGANTAIFTLFDQVLRRPLPVHAPQELTLLRFSGVDVGWMRSRNDQQLVFSYPMFRDLRDRNTVFSGLIATAPAALALGWQGQTEPATGELVSGNYFETLGLRPAAGRLFQESDDMIANANPVVVISHGYWMQRFGGNAGAVGQKLLVNGHPFTLIGVAPLEFRSVVVGDAPEAFVPMTMKGQIAPDFIDLENRRSRWLNMIGRLKPGVSKSQAEAAMNPLWVSLRRLELNQMPHPSTRLKSQFLETHLSLLDGSKGLSPLRDDFATPLVVLMSMVGLVLLIACANVANLLLARGAKRQRETAIRYALGASRVQVMREMISESTILAVSGGAFGILLAVWIADLLLHALPAETHLQLALSIAPDSRTLLFTLAVTTLAGVVFGLAPAFQSSAHGVASALKEQSPAGGGQARFRKALVMAQTGISLLLMVGALLFARSLHNLKSQDLGFRTDHLLALDLNPLFAGYQDSQVFSLYERLLQKLRSDPGVRSVSAASMGLMSGGISSGDITVAGYQPTAGENLSPPQDNVSAGYFASLGIPLIEGREFTPGDGMGAPRVAVVSETFARHFFGKNSALGHLFSINSSGRKPDIQIIGVVRDSKNATMRQKPTDYIYLPYMQVADTSELTIYIRTSQDAENAAAMARRAVHEIDPNLAVKNLATMQHLIDNDIWIDRVIAALSMSFGLLATVLAAIGLYGILAFTVMQRTREIGIRLALGAIPTTILRLVITEVLAMAGTGIVVAIPVSIGLMQYLKSLLFGLSNTDPLSLFGASIFLTLVAALAGYVPTRRAIRVDPLVALRWE